MLFNKQISWRSFLSACQTLELFLIPALLPWAMLSLVYQPLIIARFYKQSPQLISFHYVCILLNLASMGTIVVYFFYFLIKKKASEELYKQGEQSWLQIIYFLIFLPLNNFLINVPTFVIASFSSLFGNQEYVKAEKVISKKALERKY